MPLNRRALLGGTLALLTASTARAATPLKVVASSVPHAEILTYVQDKLAPDLPLRIIEISGDIRPNRLVLDGDADANFFQHVPYLRSEEAELGVPLRRDRKRACGASRALFAPRPQPRRPAEGSDNCPVEQRHQFQPRAEVAAGERPHPSQARRRRHLRHGRRHRREPEILELHRSGAAAIAALPRRRRPGGSSTATTPSNPASTRPRIPSGWSGRRATPTPTCW